MKKFYLAIVCTVITLSAFAQAKNGYVFTDIKRLPTTCVKSQDRAGTCWAWSTVSFLESEMMRIGKDSVSLSPMFVAWYTYQGKADMYVRLHGSGSFSQGGATGDVIWAVKNYGIVPLDEYTGLNYGEKIHAHSELEAVLKGYVDAIVENPNKKLSTAWKRGFDGILDAYLGKIPENFTYKGKTYTPKSFAEEVVGLNMNDYVNLTSFSHHPFYTQFAMEVPDNWMHELSYNIPLDEFMDVMDKAIDNGYSICWGADVSEFGFTRDGIAVMPVVDKANMTDAEIAKWVSMPAQMQQAELTKGPGKEKEVTQENRQEGYDNFETTDDHGMHIIGKAKDQKGNMYFIVKNSWGEYNKYKGYLYASYPFVAAKTMNILVHKDALSKDLKKKLGIK